MTSTQETILTLNQYESTYVISHFIYFGIKTYKSIVNRLFQIKPCLFKAPSAEDLLSDRDHVVGWQTLSTVHRSFRVSYYYREDAKVEITERKS